MRHRQGAVARRRRDAAFLSLLYASGLRRAEAVALELSDLDQVSGQLRVRRGKGRKPRPVSALPAHQDWLKVRVDEPGPLFSAVLKNGRLVRDPQGQLQGLSGSAAVAEMRAEGRRIDDEVLTHISPAHSENVNFFGSIAVDVERELAKLDPSGYPASRTEHGSSRDPGCAGSLKP